MSTPQACQPLAGFDPSQPFDTHPAPAVSLAAVLRRNTGQPTWDQAGEPARTAVSRSLPSCPRAEEKAQPVWNLPPVLPLAGGPAFERRLAPHHPPASASALAANLCLPGEPRTYNAGPLLSIPAPGRCDLRGRRGSCPGKPPGDCRSRHPTREEGVYGGETWMSIGVLPRLPRLPQQRGHRRHGLLRRAAPGGDAGRPAGERSQAAVARMFRNAVV